MERAHWHTFQVLTKRSSLMRNFLPRRYHSMRGPLHIWLGVSIEDQSKTSRIRHLQEAPVGVRFLSIERNLLTPHRMTHCDGIRCVTACSWVPQSSFSCWFAKPTPPYTSTDTPIQEHDEHGALALVVRLHGNIRKPGFIFVSSGFSKVPEIFTQKHIRS